MIIQSTTNYFVCASPLNLPFFYEFSSLLFSKMNISMLKTSIYHLLYEFFSLYVMIGAGNEENPS